MSLFDFFNKNKYKSDLEIYNEQRASQQKESSWTIYEEPQDSNVCFIVEDVFVITGRGTVVTGQVINPIKIGDKLKLQNRKETTIIGIEMFRTQIDFANIGDNCGILLRNVSRNEIKPGDNLYLV